MFGYRFGNEYMCTLLATNGLTGGVSQLSLQKYRVHLHENVHVLSNLLRESERPLSHYPRALPKPMLSTSVFEPDNFKYEADVNYNYTCCPSVQKYILLSRVHFYKSLLQSLTQIHPNCFSRTA